MKSKKIVAALLAAAMATTAAVSASAATLSDVNPDGSTEVTANIVDPGNVSYTITIPDKVDFGTLTQPDSNENDSYVYRGFDVEATEINIKSGQSVSVWVKDSCSDFATDGRFCIKQKDKENPNQFQYDVFASTVDDSNIADSTAINSTASPGKYGYFLCAFPSDAQGNKLSGTIALNQKALYGLTLSDIAGDYSGNMVFHSALIGN